MTDYALVAPDNSIHQTKAQSRIDFNAGVKTGYRWLPIVIEVTDNTTQSDYVVADPEVVTVEADRVLRSRVRRDMTAQEKSDVQDAMLANMDKVQNAVLWELIQRVKVLQNAAGINEAQMDTAKGNLTLTRAQALAIIKAGM